MSRLAGKLSLIALLISVMLAGASGLQAQTALTTRIGDAVSSFYNSAKGATFTISRIEPQTQNNTVLVYFTDPCNPDELRWNLKLIPPVPLEWGRNSFSRERNMLTLRGHFSPGQRYAVVLPPKFTSANGKSYEKGVTSFTMPDRDPDIAFVEQGSVIERNSRQMMHVQIMNVDELFVQGIRVPPALVPFAMQQISQNSRQPDMNDTLHRVASRFRETLGHDGDFRDILGDVTEDGQLFFTQNRERNVYHQFSVPLTFRKNKEQGAIEIIRIAIKRGGPGSPVLARMYSITDMGISYKLSENELLFWVTSLYSGKPLGGVSLYAFTAANEVVPLGKTDARGLLVTQNNLLKKRASLNSGSEGVLTAAQLPLREIRAVAAVSSTDQTFVEILREGNVRPEGIEQARPERKSDPLLKGHVFTERGIYRPGETVYFKGTVREYKDGTVAPPRELTALLRIVNSKNEEVYRKNIALSEFGTANDQLALKTFFPLGTYTLHMSFGPGNKDHAERSFEVQEFRQPRHYVEIRYTRETKRDEAYVNLDMKKEILNCSIEGKYYAGGPVKHGKVRWSIYHAKSDYPRQDHPGYAFGYPLDPRTDLIESGEALLDEKGQITVPVPVGKDVLSGRYGIEVVASVVDFDGRASTESSVYQADPDYLVGISSHPSTVLPGESQTLYAVVIDRKGGKVARGSVLVQVMERGYTYIQKRNAEGYLYNEQQQIWRSQLSTDLPIRDDRAVFDFDFTRGGEYLITFTYRDQGGREYASATRYTMPGYYGYSDYDGNRHEDQKNYGKIRLYPEKPLYTAGETIKLFLNPPRRATSCLVTVEQGGLVEFFTTELKPDQQFIELPVKDSYNPNVYISVLATVPRSSFPVYTGRFDKEAPSFLFGTANVEVKGSQQKINIAINEEQKKLKSLPGTEMTLNIGTSDQGGKGIVSELAIAVVDESILSMTGFETPSLDLLGKFLLPLGVYTGDLRLNILRQTPYEFLRNAPLTGGDGDEGPVPEAVTSKVRKDFNPVAYFNPSVRTDENGKAAVTFTFPDTMTTYRVYAVACDKGSRFGTYQRSALVVKDFYLEPGLPAFFTRGDRFTFAVSAFNKTDRSGSVDFAVKPDELVSLSSAKPAYALPGFDRTLIPVHGSAQKAGISRMQFSGRFRDHADTIELKVPVNSGHVLGNDTVYGNFRKYTDVKYDLPKAVKELRWEEAGPEEVKAVLTVSGSPFMRMSQGLRYFLRYPYG